MSYESETHAANQVSFPEGNCFVFGLIKRLAGRGSWGDLMQICLALKIEGLDSVVKPLKNVDYPKNL